MIAARIVIVDRCYPPAGSSDPRSWPSAAMAGDGVDFRDQELLRGGVQERGLYAVLRQLGYLTAAQPERRPRPPVRLLASCRATRTRFRSRTGAGSARVRGALFDPPPGRAGADCRPRRNLRSPTYGDPARPGRPTRRSRARARLARIVPLRRGQNPDRLARPDLGRARHRWEHAHPVGRHARHLAGTRPGTPARRRSTVWRSARSPSAPARHDQRVLHAGDASNAKS